MRLPQALGLLLGPGALALTAIAGLAPSSATSGLRFSVTFKAEKSKEPLDGRLLLILSKDKTAEPRTQVSDSILRTQQVFGVDVDGWKPGAPLLVAGDALGYPVESLAAVPPGTYRVQALLHRYETFHRADGHVVKLPMDRGEGQQWNKAPGNLYSTPQEITIDGPASPPRSPIELDKVIPPIPEPPTTKYIKHERIQSERLTKFWGRPDAPRRARPPARGLRRRTPTRATRSSSSTATSPRRSAASARSRPTRTSSPTTSERFHLDGYNRIEQEHAHQFYKEWTGPATRA